MFYNKSQVTAALLYVAAFFLVFTIENSALTLIGAIR
jgi:hypothetical protein